MRADVLIIGCGIGGATAALRLAQDREREIVLLTREDHAEESNSSYAQGGIVGRGTDDSADLLVEDVLREGAKKARAVAREVTDRARSACGVA